MSGNVDYFWPCQCTEPWWQTQFGKMQPRCGTCLSVAEFFAMDHDKQAAELHKLFGARSLISAWICTGNIPMDVARQCAGWGEFKLHGQ